MKFVYLQAFVLPIFYKNNLKKRIAARPLIKNYEKFPSKEVVIFSFDIPEKERVKRAWVRGVLKNLGFTMIQQSVWLGKGPLPKQFTERLQLL